MSNNEFDCDFIKIINHYEIFEKTSNDLMTGYLVSEC